MATEASGGNVGSICVWRPWRRSLRCAALALVLCAPVRAYEIVGMARAIDGDSLQIGTQELRLHGIDAPEAGQNCRIAGAPWRCGQAAAAALAAHLGRGVVRCSWSQRDVYDRALATCFYGDTNINAALVNDGFALAYRRYSERYTAEQTRAQQAGRGLWAGEFEPPWVWRARADKVHGRCPIKGNVNRHGERIYHLPGSPDYERIRIRAAEGDQCFDSELAARAAGFRARRSAQ